MEGRTRRDTSVLNRDARARGVRDDGRDEEGARIAAVRRAVRGAAASTSYSTPSVHSSRRMVTTNTDVNADLDESSPRLTRAAAVLREAKALMRELSPSSTLSNGTPSSAGGGSSASSVEAPESRWKSLRKSYDAIEADKASRMSGHHGTDGPTPLPKKTRRPRLKFATALVAEAAEVGIEVGEAALVTEIARGAEEWEQATAGLTEGDDALAKMTEALPGTIERAQQLEAQFYADLAAELRDVDF